MASFHFQPLIWGNWDDSESQRQWEVFIGEIKKNTYQIHWMINRFCATVIRQNVGKIICNYSLTFIYHNILKQFATIPQLLVTTKFSSVTLSYQWPIHTSISFVKRLDQEGGDFINQVALYSASTNLYKWLLPPVCVTSNRCVAHDTTFIAQYYWEIEVYCAVCLAYKGDHCHPFSLVIEVLWWEIWSIRYCK